jgi:hypothetical protein
MDIFSNFVLALSGEIVDFYNSGTFAVIKFILGIYTIVLIIDIVLLLFHRGLGIDIRENFLGVNIPKEFVKKKGKLKANWGKILERLESENVSEYKVAVIEADNLIDDLIKRMGYKGENMSERMMAIPAGHIDNLDKIKEAHEVRNRIIHEENFTLSKEEAKKILDNFAHLLHIFEVLD